MKVTEYDLKYYAEKHNIYDMSSENLIRLITKPYPIKSIAKEFNITTKEFNNIKRQRGITNVILEDTIRNIEVILDYLDLQNSYISYNIRSQLIKEISNLLLSEISQRDNISQEILKINFSREKVKKDLIDKEIDKEYRINKLENIIEYISKKANKLKQEEKKHIFEDNKKLYNKLSDEKKKGKEFSRKDLTYDVLFELAINEGIVDSLIGEIFNLTKSQINYIRRKENLSNKFLKKIEANPEIIIYRLEDVEGRDPKLSNYDYERALISVIQNKNQKRNQINNDKSFKIIISNADKEEKYNIRFSNKKFSTNIGIKSKKSVGSHHNYIKENEAKILHGKTGEKIVLEAEKKRLTELGLIEYANKVEIIAQVNDEITLDGIGYDILSYDELGRPICIEAKTSYGKRDKPFFITKKELDLIEGTKEEYNCNCYIIYYVLIDKNDVTIKKITQEDFNILKREPYLYIIK